ncbi:DUF4391 domain-containing protein [Megasphaera sp. DISK 18]|uniref:DUF4391 domain-containing protein n=1 Tax=Megasphaera sp. DISK 18 TaxID=1776081 RepID=UPI0008070985|nr:DUF4391 domain-containing protein [Megasphaera sp. DISK 18]OBZ32102.1 hypothetical protein A0U42_02845 [Megasphaera sp. DISK 18]
MIEFPESTKVGRRLPKEAFYKHLPLTPSLKKKFVSDVETIFVENSLTAKNLNLSQETEIKEILLLSIILKKQEFDTKIVEAIAKQNPHPLIFRLAYGEDVQLAIYHHKLYRGEWNREENMNLVLDGNLTDIWENLIRQIAVRSENMHPQRTQSLDEQLKTQADIERLKKLIQRTATAAWKEIQPKKRFELYTELQKYKKKLEEITHGQA